jgi:hypothetical protein
MSGDAQASTTTDISNGGGLSSARSRVLRRISTAVSRERLAATWAKIDNGLERAGDRLNPILVKETRQALKSWQFTWAFLLLLVACWVVTIGGVAMIGPSIYYAAGGGAMLLWYWGILAFLLLVVVPYAAFRSLAAEREDNTYDLLSITTLRPRQIISGKLASAVVQMAVFFSAIMPCLAFTYLLRGVDLPTIALLLTYTFFGSLGLSMLGLLLATAARQRYGQVILSVAFVALLLSVFWLAVLTGSGLMQTGYALFGERAFWIAHLAVPNIYVTTFALVYFAAASMITFAAENRSTALRIIMLIQQASCIGWAAWAWIESEGSPAPIFWLALVAGLYWFIMGAIMNGEAGEMSRRVKRRLPQSTLGRALFTWLNPGSGSGLMFAVANLTTIVLLGVGGLFIHSYSAITARGSVGTEPCLYFLLIGWGYVVAYLCLGRLAVALLRQFAVVTMMACVLIHILLVLAGSGIPTTIQWMSVAMQHRDYSYLQLTNPFWSLSHIVKGSLPAEATVLLIVVPTAAICMLLANMPSVVRELRQVRSLPPARVLEDEAVLHPQPLAGPQSPWDQDC